MTNEIQDIVIIGTGNVSYHLVRAFQKAGMNIAQVLAHSETSARRFAGDLDVTAVVSVDKLIRNADLYILAVNDDYVKPLAESLGLSDRFIVHTSGTVSLDALDGLSVNRGVFYPLQTFSYGSDMDFSEVPVCLEANTNENLHLLERLASKVTRAIYLVDSEKRRKLHLAAVFASNFSYHMYTIAAKILETDQISPEILNTLILETAKKAVLNPPGKAQTGPATREDREVIEKHLEELKDFGHFREIYLLLTESIIALKKNQNDEL